jgi:nickel transport protein
VLATAGKVHAHRLDAQCVVLSGKRVRVESWFSTGDKPRGARVNVFRANEQLLTTGKLDRNGEFIFTFTEVEPLRVVVDAGGGHRNEVMIPAVDLEASAAVAGEGGPEPVADHRGTFPTGGVLTGLGILFAVAGFFAWRSRSARRSETGG